MEKSNKNNNYAVIMAGGVGSRFWPISRQLKPKQFLDIMGIGKTLLQLTLERYKQIIEPENIYIVTNTLYENLVKIQCPEIPENNILLEPARKNTAPCIAYAAFKIAAKNENANIFVAASDHLILQENIFINIVNQAFSITAANDVIITLGLKPTRPDTGYGYIQFEESKKLEEGTFKVKSFTEKPDKILAKQFMESGEFLWNSGMFAFNVKTIINAFETFLPEIYDLFKANSNTYNTSNEKLLIQQIYPQCSNISIDFGIMEKAKNVYVIPGSFGWSDLGTWASLYEQLEKDYMGNAVVAKNAVMYDSTNCMISVTGDKLIVVEGLHDCIVVDDNDVLLICKKENEQEIKSITADLKLKQGDKYL